MFDISSALFWRFSKYTTPCRELGASPIMATTTSSLLCSTPDHHMPRTLVYRYVTIWRKSPSSSISTAVYTIRAKISSFPTPCSSTSPALAFSAAFGYAGFGGQGHLRILARHPSAFLADECWYRSLIMTSQPRLSHRWYPGMRCKRLASNLALSALSLAKAAAYAARSPVHMPNTEVRERQGERERKREGEGGREGGREGEREREREREREKTRDTTEKAVGGERELRRCDACLGGTLHTNRFQFVTEDCPRVSEGRVLLQRG